MAVALLWPAASFAQDVPTPAPVPAANPEPEIDQALVNLQTTMPLKAHRSYFRITHRFARDLRRGSFGSLAEDFFSLDNGAVIGLEYRIGLTSTIQAGIHRSILGKTIVAFSRWDAVRQRAGRPASISAGVSIEGQNNLRLDPQPGVSATLSHAHGSRLLLYASPTYVHNAHTGTLQVLHEGHTHDAGDDDADEDASDATDTFFVGLGARIRLRKRVSVALEASPRMAGYRPDRAAWGVGLEKLTRGHVLQLNFSNSFGTTPGQIARGGSRHDVYMGFNLSRKF